MAMKRPIVRPYDAPATWHVKSGSRGDVWHLVDVLAWTGFGECSCEHYHFHIRPELAAGRCAKRCKHIDAAREAFTDFMIQLLSSKLHE